MENKLLKAIIMLSKHFLYGFLFQLLVINFTFAWHANGQLKSIDEVTISLKRERLSLAQFFYQVEKQTDFVFNYDRRDINLVATLEFSKTNGTVEQFLVEAAKSNGLSFQQINRNINVKRNSSSDSRIPMETELGFVVTGTVRDESGLPFPGVTVLVPNTNRGTVTDVNGSYSIEVNEGETLLFSFIGYTQQSVTIGTQTIIDISLSPDLRALEEVIVIGFGEKSRRLMTESIGQVNSKELMKLPVASADAALQGRISGVQITSVDGTPGAPVAVRIRGVGTVGNTQPLFVIDGVPVGNNSDAITNPLSTINPADIESISVLKDASAAAVYGVRAANGVVLITTKRGAKGKPTVTLDSYTGIQQIARFNEYNSTSEYVRLQQDAFTNFNTQNNLSPSDPNFQVLHPDLRQGSPILNRDNRLAWRDETLNQGAPITNLNLGVNGGGEGYNYFVSGGYFGQEATIQKWNLERYTFRANSDFKVNKRLSFGQNFTVAYQKIERGMNGGGDGFLLQNSMTMPPFFNIFDNPANPIPGNRYGFDGNADLAGLTIANQIGINQIIQNFNRNIRLLGGVYGELEIVDGLKFRSAASIDFNMFRNDSWRPEYLVAEMGLNRPGNQFDDTRGENQTQVFTNTMNYNRQLGKHNLDVLAGLEYQNIRSTSLGVQAFDFLSTNPGFYQVVKNGRGDPNIGGGAGNASFVGYLGRASYNYAEKYLFTATIRRDGTSSFSPENNRRWGTFPSFSGAWIISEESFFNKGIINDLKLRGSWGQLGNSNTAAYPHIFRVSTTPDYALGGSNTIQAPSPINFVNKDVVWETVETFDAGFDLTLLDNKLDILATYYNRNTKDFLFFLPLSTVTGFNSTPVNLGTVNNRGLELEIGYRQIFKNGFKMYLSGNLTTVKNRLVELAPGLEEFTASDIYRTAIGMPIGYFYGYQTNGIYQTQAEIDAIFKDGFIDRNSPQGPRPGDVKFIDNNGPGGEGKQFSGQPDGLIDFNDRTYLGKTIPSFFYGLTANLEFKNFDLAMLWQGVGDVQIYNEVRRNGLNLQGVGRNMFTETQQRWTGPGTSNSMPRAISGDPNQNNRFSDRFVENAGYLRLRNLQIGYSLPKSLTDRWNGFGSGRIYLGGTNLLTFTKYSGMDPEVMTFGQNAVQIGAGTDRGNMPQPRIYQLGIQLTF